MFYYLSLAAALFAIGIYGILARLDFPGKLVALFIMVNAIFINLTAFNKFVQTDSTTGLVFIFFACIMALTEFCLAALVIRQLTSASAPNDHSNPAETVQ